MSSDPFHQVKKTLRAEMNSQASERIREEAALAALALLGRSVRMRHGRPAQPVA